jgi:hypothetical protein
MPSLTNFFYKEKCSFKKLLSACTYIQESQNKMLIHHSVYECLTHNFDGSFRNIIFLIIIMKLCSITTLVRVVFLTPFAFLYAKKKKKKKISFMFILPNFYLRHRICHFSKEPPGFLLSRYNTFQSSLVLEELIALELSLILDDISGQIWPHFMEKGYG